MIIVNSTLHSNVKTFGASLVNLLAMQETRVRSLGQESPLEKEMETLSNILAWKIPQTEAPGVSQFMEFQRVKHN